MVYKFFKQEQPPIVKGLTEKQKSIFLSSISQGTIEIPKKERQL
jgi:hypothetical protein